MKIFYDQSKDKVRILPDPKYHDLEHLIAYALSTNEEKGYKEHIQPIIDRGVNEDEVLIWLKSLYFAGVFEYEKMQEFIKIVKKNYTIY